MLDRIFNASPTIYKWDNFWVGFLPAIISPFVMFFVLYGLAAAASYFGSHEKYMFEVYLYSMRSPTLFLRVTTLCCIPNGAIFFFLISRNYMNASRGVVLVTMLFVIAIVIRDVS